MYLIVGASGFLGRYCVKNILEHTSDTILGTYSNERSKPIFVDSRVEWKKLDICNESELSHIAELVNQDTKIIYLAAFHHPDKVEEQPELAWDINIVALARAVNMFHKAKCLFYSSTDVVYGEGSKDKKFVESDSLNPVNRYGEHKVLAEKICLAKGFNVVRFPFMFGPSLVEGKIHFFDKIVADLGSDKVVEMFNDSYRSTLSFNQCAFYLIKLIEKFGANAEKIVNIASDDALSKFDVALRLAMKFGLNGSLVHGVSISSCEKVFKVKRAKNSVLDNNKLKRLLGLKEIHLEI